MGLLQIIAGRYQQWVENGRKIFESIWVRDSVDERHMCTIMPCAHLPVVELWLHLDLVFAASAVEEARSSDCSENSWRDFIPGWEEELLRADGTADQEGVI